MAHSLSAKKRVRQIAKRRELNRDRKKIVKVQVKKLLGALDAGDLAVAKTELQVTTKVLDKVAAKGTLHKNTVARRKSRLAKKVNALAAKA